MNKEMLDFKYRPLVNTLYQRYPNYFNETDYQEIIEKNFNNKTTRYKETYYKIKTYFLMLLDTVFWFLFSLFMRCFVFLAMGILIGIYTFTSNSELFFQFAQNGMKYYDIFLSWIFRFSSQEINTFILNSSEATKAGEFSFANVSYSLETEYLFFGVMIMLILVLIWFVLFAFRFYREYKKYDHDIEDLDANMNTKKALRLLNCDEFDSFKYIKKQFYRYYFKKMIHKNEQLNCIVAYVHLCKEKEFFNSYSDENKTIATRKLYLKILTYTTNLICCAFVISLTLSLTLLINYHQAIESEGLIGIYTYIIEKLPGGFMTSLTSYQNGDLAYQAASHVFFCIFILVIIIKIYSSIIKPTIQFKERYLNYLTSKELEPVEAIIEPIVDEENKFQAKTFENTHQLKQEIKYNEKQNTIWIAIFLIYLFIYFTAISLS